MSNPSIQDCIQYIGTMHPEGFTSGQIYREMLAIGIQYHRVCVHQKILEMVQSGLVVILERGGGWGTQAKQYVFALTEEARISLDEE